jgi:hypothetical protein
MWKRIMIIIISVLLACLLLLFLGLVVIGPGKPIPFTGENGMPLAGSVSEKIFVRINGAEQGMFLKGKDSNNRMF